MKFVNIGKYTMKEIFWVIAALGVLSAGYVIFASGQANAGFFDSIATSNWPTKQSNAFKVEAYGFDFRVYEWQTDADSNTICTVAIGNSSSAPYMGMECFQKTQ